MGPGYKEKPLDNISTVIYGGGSKKFYGCFAAGAPEALVKIDGIVNFAKHI